MVCVKCNYVSILVYPFRLVLEDIQISCGTWPGSTSLSQLPDTLHQVLKAREAPVSTVGQDSLGVHEETRQSVGAEWQEESLLGDI